MKRDREGDPIPLISRYDLFASINEILQTIPTAPSPPCQLRGVFVSQLYSIPPHNRTEIDKAVRVERDNLNIKGIRGGHDILVMKMADYIDELEYLKKGCGNVTTMMTTEISLFIKFAVNSNKLSVFKKDLNDLLISDSTIKYLATKGYLSYRRDISNSLTDLFWFALPNLGLLNQSIIETRNIVLSIINKKTYKEISLAELLKYSPQDNKERITKAYRNMKFCTHMGLRYHIYDLIGNKIVTSVDLPTRGILLRLLNEK